MALSAAFSAAAGLPRMGWEFLLHEIEHHPMHVLIDTIMILAVIYVLRMPVHKARDPDRDKPTKEEEEEILRDFCSAPFEVPVREALPDAPVVSGYHGIRATLENGSDVINCASFDFLAYATDDNVIEAAQDTIVKYGCGSCGPRGFYGSLKPHLDLESRLAAFMNTAACIIYSFSFATVSTLIPCFCARGDDILADDMCNLAVQIGCRLSRSNLTYFRHNDMAHLEELMKESHARQKKKGKKAPPRRTVVIEGVYRNSGTLANLPAIVRLAQKYKFRVLLDDSMGFAAIGKTGRGTPEHFGVPIKDIDIYVGAMSTSLGSVGGFCVGAAAMVDHQRLAATGYVYSASLPPYASVAAITIIDKIEANPSRVLQLQANAKAFRKLFTSGKVKLPNRVSIVHNDLSEESPVVHFGVSAKDTEPAAECRQRFFAAAESVLADGVMVTAVKFNDQERMPPPPSLRVTIKSELTAAEVEVVATKVAAAIAAHF